MLDQTCVEFAVRAETKTGDIFTLRRHFQSRDAAESHPVLMSKWRRVWVEEMPRPQVEVRQKQIPNPDEAPLPWRIQWVKGFTYLVDADGRKLASLLGSRAKREKVGAVICGRTK